MKCTNKVRRIRFCMSLILCMFLLLPDAVMWRIHFRTMSIPVSAVSMCWQEPEHQGRALCCGSVCGDGGPDGDGSVDMSQASAAVLFDVNNRGVIFQKCT